MEGREFACVDCGATFAFTEAETVAFAARGFAPPKRCKPCRAAKRKRQSGAAQDRPPEARVKRRNNGPVEFHPAVCTTCGAATEVPFVPDGVRPTYCLPCLKQRTR